MKLIFFTYAVLLPFLRASSSEVQFCELKASTGVDFISCASADGGVVATRDVDVVESGTVCVTSCNNSLALCGGGAWSFEYNACSVGTSSEMQTEVEVRPKRFFGFIIAAVFIIGSLFSHSRPADNEPPAIINLPGNIEAFADPIQTNTYHITWKEPYATDNKDGRVSVYRHGPGSGWTFSEGVTWVTYSAKDSSGNEARKSFYVNVKVIRCAPVPSKRFPNGYYVCHPSSDFVLGATCRYGCYSGYELKGASVRTCEQQGQSVKGRWSNPEPICRKIKCQDLKPTDDSKLECDDHFNFRSKCIYNCSAGYDVEPGMNRIRVCTANGNWRGDKPICIDSEPPKFTSCPSYQTFFTEQRSSRAFTNWPEPKATDNSKTSKMSIVSTISNQNFEAVGVFKVMYKVEDGVGNKGRDCIFKVVVRELSCPTQFAHPYMRVDCPDGYRYGTSCNFTCQSGYSLLGADDTTRCDKPSSAAKYVQWTKKQPTCNKLQTCPALQPPGNGALACDLWENGRYCQMQCMKGTDIPPTFSYKRLFVCGESGDWDFNQKIPDCAKVRSPSSTRLRMKLYCYFDGECPNADTIESIKRNFLVSLKNSAFTEAWVEGESRAENVHVLCGPITVKRSTNSSHGSEYRVETDLVSDMNPSEDFATQFNEKKKKMETLVDLIRLNNETFIPESLGPVDGVSVEAGQANLDCPFGTFPTYRTYGCVGCVRGSFYDVNSGQCEECPIGHFTDKAGQIDCTACPLHTTTLNRAASSRLQCQAECRPGWFSITGVEPCSPCSAGSYQEEWGKRECPLCPANKITKTQGSMDINDCHEFDLEFPDVGKPNAKLELTTDVDVQVDTFTLVLWFRVSSSTGRITSISADGKMLWSLQVVNHSLKTTFMGQEEYSSLSVNDSSWHQYVLQQSIRENSVTSYIDLEPDNTLGLTNISLSNASSVLIRVGGSGLVGSVSQLNIWSSDHHVSQAKCFLEEAGDLLAWHQFVGADLDGSFLQIPSECDDTDACESNPCVEGECVDELDGYSCSCRDGFTGRDCDINKDDCLGHMCGNNATCIDGVGNYTCACTEDFTGEFCDDVLVHGGWGPWGNWSRCSEECNGGRWSRSRRCDNPVPQNGGSSCEGEDVEEGVCNNHTCPVCADVSPPNNGSFNCEVKGKMTLCNVSCDEGFDFDIQPLDVYQCGKENGYIWNFLTKSNPYQRLPNCMEISPPEELTVYYAAEYLDLVCSDKPRDNIVRNVKSVLEAELANTPCLIDRRCQLKEITVDTCENKQRTRRSANTVAFNVTLTNYPLATNGLIAGLKDISSAVTHMNSSGYSGSFTVNMDGEDFHLNLPSIQFLGDVKCPASLSRVDAYCIPCGPGTYGLNGVCRLCDYGRYQNTTGQAFCVACPAGKTTAGQGAIAEEECNVDTESSGWTVSVAVIAGSVSACLLLIAALIVFIYWRWKSRDNKVKAIELELQTIQRQIPYLLSARTAFTQAELERKFPIVDE